MTDEIQKEILFRFLDGETSEHENQQLEKMLAASAELRSLKKDLEDIRRYSKLNDIQSPSHLEGRIISKIQEQYPRRQRSVLLTTISGIPFRFAAALVFLIGSASFFYYPMSNLDVGNQVATEPSVEQAIENVILARDQYGAAIAELESLAIVRLEELPTDLVVVFTENLEILDEAIALYESNMEAIDPYSSSYYMLSDIYELKIELLTTILEV